MTARSRPAVGRPPRFDVLIAGGGLLCGLLLWTLDLHGGPPLLGLPAALTLVSLTAMAVAELMRRTAPMAALALAVPALTLDLCAGTLIA
ncbi:two-component sensor histidine kinase, partial [Streptomyces nigrescens]